MRFERGIRPLQALPVAGADQAGRGQRKDALGRPFLAEPLTGNVAPSA